MHIRRLASGSTATRPALAALAALLMPLSLAGTAAASPVDVDESRLVPSLSQSFAPWTCKMKITGPVCDGERHILSDWHPDGIPCDVPLYNRRTENRFSTRFYDQNYLNYDRKFRSNDIDEYSISPSGPGGVTIRSNVRFSEPFDVPGDDSTFDVISDGILWDIQGANGSPVWLVVGTLVEPHDGSATFTGHATKEGVTTRYVDAPLEDVLDEDWFFAQICETAKANG
jgi:hypothetical protein